MGLQSIAAGLSAIVKATAVALSEAQYFIAFWTCAIAQVQNAMKYWASDSATAVAFTIADSPAAIDCRPTSLPRPVH